MTDWLKRHRYVLLACLFLCFVFFVTWKTESARGNCTEPVQAIVIQEKEKRTSRNSQAYMPHITYDSVVSYEVDGQEHRGTLRHINQKLGVGNEVLIYYDPDRMDKPYSVVLPYQLEEIKEQYLSREGQLSLICISIIFTAVFMALANSFDKKREQRKRAKEENQ